MPCVVIIVTVPHNVFGSGAAAVASGRNSYDVRLRSASLEPYGTSLFALSISSRTPQSKHLRASTGSSPPAAAAAAAFADSPTRRRPVPLSFWGTVNSRLGSVLGVEARVETWSSSVVHSVLGKQL